MLILTRLRYLTPHAVSWMNLPSFRHVVMALKNFNDTKYDTIHRLYHRYHLKTDHIDIIHIQKIYVRTCMIWRIPPKWPNTSFDTVSRVSRGLDRRALFCGKATDCSGHCLHPLGLSHSALQDLGTFQRYGTWKLMKKQEVRGIGSIVLWWYMICIIYIYMSYLYTYNIWWPPSEKPTFQTMIVVFTVFYARFGL